jgi:hypothetical protein
VIYTFLKGLFTLPGITRIVLGSSAICDFSYHRLAIAISSSAPGLFRRMAYSTFPA